MAKKCKYLREGNLCAARSFRMQNIALLSIRTMSGGVARNVKIQPHFQCKGDLYFYVECHAHKLLFARSMSRRKVMRNEQTAM